MSAALQRRALRYFALAVVLVVLCALAPVVAAQQLAALGLHTASMHAPAADWQNNRNPGLYLRTADGVTVGGYRNTLGRPTFYAGRTWLDVVGPVDVLVAGATGYRLRSPVVPLLVASVELAPRSWGRVPRLALAAGNGTAVLHLSIEGSF